MKFNIIFWNFVIGIGIWLAIWSHNEIFGISFFVVWFSLVSLVLRNMWGRMKNLIVFWCIEIGIGIWLAIWSHNEIFGIGFFVVWFGFVLVGIVRTKARMKQEKEWADRKYGEEMIKKIKNEKEKQNQILVLDQKNKVDDIIHYLEDDVEKEKRIKDWI